MLCQYILQIKLNEITAGCYDDVIACMCFYLLSCKRLHFLSFILSPAPYLFLLHPLPLLFFLGLLMANNISWGHQE